MLSQARQVDPRKYGRVLRTLRAEIVAGTFAPRQMLPSQQALAQRFDVSTMTVRVALDQLARDGFLRSQPRLGTFVVDRPPHLANYALVFPFDPAAPDEGEHRWWSKYYQAITAAAADLQRELVSRLALFHGIDYHGDSEDRQRLLDHLHSHRLAGIIFAHSPHAAAGPPILDQPGLPRVVLASEQQNPHVPAITFDGEQWLVQALDRLQQRGRHRVAVLFNRLGGPLREQVARALAARGLSCPAVWQQAAEYRDPDAASHCVQLLLNGPAADRPDGLLVMDDNLVEGVTAGLVAAGLRVPADVDVVAHANYPLLAPPALPFHVLGYDLGAALRTGLELIDRQRQGEPVAGVTALPAVWREDWQPAVVRQGVMA